MYAREDGGGRIALQANLSLPPTMKLCPNTTIAVRWKFAETNKTLPDSNGSKNYSADNAQFVFFTRLTREIRESAKIAKSVKSVKIANQRSSELTPRPFLLLQSPVDTAR